jgi:hypothetical protein
MKNCSFLQQRSIPEYKGAHNYVSYTDLFTICFTSKHSISGALQMAQRHAAEEAS